MAKAEAASFHGSIPWPLARLKVFAELQKGVGNISGLNGTKDGN